MVMFDIPRLPRFAVVAGCALVYMGFAWGLVSSGYLLVSTELYLSLVASWLGGMLVLSWPLPASDVASTMRRVFFRLLWFNLGGVAVAVLVPNELRFLMLVVPLFGVLYAALRLNGDRVLFIAAATWLSYVASTSALLWLGSVEMRFEVLAGLAFSFLLAGMVYFAGDLEALRRRAESRQQYLEKSVEELSGVAMRDELTGVFNRRYILEALKRHKALADRDRLEFTVCYCDMDHFKRVNDQLGHAAGDRALVQFAELAVSLVRSMDYVARLGGEEFLLVLVGANEKVAERVCERLCDKTRELVLEGRHAVVQRLSVSCGVARYRLGESTDDLLQRADRALYEAKRAGRDRVVTAGD